MKKSLMLGLVATALSTGLYAQCQGGSCGAAPQCQGRYCQQAQGQYQQGQQGQYQQGQQGQGAPMASAMSDDDRRIYEKVMEKLSALNRFANVKVVVQNRNVTLSGTVPTQNAKSDAEKMANDVKGVAKVDNQIQVVAPSKQ